MGKTILTLILLFGVGILFLLYLQPEWLKMRNLRRENGLLRSLSLELDGLIENRDFLLDSINQISKNDLDRVNEALPQGQQAAPLLAFFESLAGRNGLVLKNIELFEKTEAKTTVTSAQPRPGLVLPTPKPQGPVKEFPITMSLFGTYDSFKNFLGGLEKNLRLIDIQDVSFSATGEEDLFSISLKVKIFYQ